MFGALEIEDESEVENPTEFKNEISDDVIYEFEKLAKSLGFTGISYGRIHFKDKDKFPQNSNSIILLLTSKGITLDSLLSNSKNPIQPATYE